MLDVEHCIGASWQVPQILDLELERERSRDQANKRNSSRMIILYNL